MTEAINRYHTAKGYFQSAIMIHRSPYRNDGRQILTLLAMCMLMGFALELYFKAYLLGAGRPSREVRGYNHHVRRLYEDAKAAGLEGTMGWHLARLNELVDIFAPGHQDLTFRYIGEGAEVIEPHWDQAFAILNELDTVVDRHVGASASHGLEPGH